jgi:membrane protease YdiL (CAAX protease family)
MKLFNYLLGVVIVLAVTAVTIIVAGNLLITYADILSLLIVILLPLPPMIGLFGWKGFWSSLGLAFRREAAEPEEYRHAAEVVRFLGRLIYLSAVLGFFIGFIGILTHYKAEETTELLAANFGVSLLVIFYAIVLNLVFVEPIRAYLKSRS